MRITNKIIQNNSLTNINTNKLLQDKLSTMLSSEKKIARPSDDPIVALRSLRLRTSVNQTIQYVEKNVEDAKSWLTVTEDSIDTLSDIITDIKKQYTKGTSDQLTAADRAIILDSLNSYIAEIYNTGNADFAGRSVFTGYRTDITLTYQADEDAQYDITEKFENVTKDTIKDIHVGNTENDVVISDIVRIRVSYNKLDDNPISGTVELTDPITTIDLASVTDTVHKDATSNPYDYVVANPDRAVYVPETGEILFGANLVSDPKSISDCEITYSKTKWDKGDLRPEHYFDCKDNTNNKVYSSHGGEIQYNIGVNQSLRINTTADECFSHNIVRDVQDVINAIKEVEDIEKKISDIEAEIKGYTSAQTTQLEDAQARLDAAKKAQTYINDKMHNLFASSITKADEYLDVNNVALTNCGTRSKRLELIENRLDTQLSSLKELKSENEDADLAETAIKMSSAGYAYDASLMATSKILQETLLNYI